MRKLLWIGDAACDSGFARSTHNILNFLRYEWDVTVLGLNYRGDPHRFPYPIYPAYVYGCSDFLGVDRISEILPIVNPELIVIQNDPWNFSRYLDALLRAKYSGPTVGIVAIDGLNCAGHLLTGLDRAIFWTEFGRNEAVQGGFSGPTSVIPLGVNLDIYSPYNQRAARKELGFTDELLDVYVVGNVNRNQPRKRLDLTVAYFAEWVKNYKVDDAYLFLHIGPTGEMSYNCQQLMSYYGLKKRIIRSDPGVWNGISEDLLAKTYSCFDVQLTTTQGEGFGLPTLEGMACGVPQIVPNWSALGEWTAPAAFRVECTSTIATPGSTNPIGGIMDRDKAVQVLATYYSDINLRARDRLRCFDHAQQTQFRWSNIGLKIADQLRATVIHEPKLEAVS